MPHRRRTKMIQHLCRMNNRLVVMEVRKMFEKIDKTIEAVCDRVQRKSKEGAFEDMELPDLVSALAELISARDRLTKES